jgi:hypothetical protein
MTTKSAIRGFTGVEVAIVLGIMSVLGVGGMSIKKAVDVFRGDDTAKAKQEAAALADAQARAQAAEHQAQAARDEAAAAQARLAEQHRKQDAAAAENVAGVIIALRQETDPSLNVTAGLALAKSAAAALDPVPDDRLRAMQEFVAQLTSQNATLRAQAQDALKARDEAIAAGQRAQDALRGEVAMANKHTAEVEAQSRAVGEERDQAVGRTTAAVAEMKTLAQKLSEWAHWTFAGVALLVLALWLLPILAKAFPGVAWLGWIAKKAGAVLAFGLHALHTEETKWTEDGLTAAGRALAAVRAELPEAAAKVTEIFDRKVSDPEHQAIIAAGAKADPNP